LEADQDADPDSDPDADPDADADPDPYQIFSDFRMQKINFFVFLMF
jgi:hypothetical protein